jgi:hypothetical protein
MGVFLPWPLLWVCGDLGIGSVCTSVQQVHGARTPAEEASTVGHQRSSKHACKARPATRQERRFAAHRPTRRAASAQPVLRAHQTVVGHRSRFGPDDPDD